MHSANAPGSSDGLCGLAHVYDDIVPVDFGLGRIRRDDGTGSDGEKRHGAGKEKGGFHWG